jgi:hypothetical protein
VSGLLRPRTATGGGVVIGYKDPLVGLDDRMARWPITSFPEWCGDFARLAVGSEARETGRWCLVSQAPPSSRYAAVGVLG